MPENVLTAPPKAPASFAPPGRVEGLWLRSSWPALLTFCALAGLWVLTLGNPLEIAERRWMGQILCWRYEHGLAPPMDPHIVLLDVTLADLRTTPSLESEYQKIADLLRMTTNLGARVVVFDVIFGRGTAPINAPILRELEKAQAQGRRIVWAEALVPGAEGQRMRSFPEMERIQPAGLINVQADPDGVFRQYEFGQRTGAGYEPSLALAGYLAWREIAWEAGVTFPQPQTMRWEEIGEDFVSVQAHLLPVGPSLLNMRAPWTGKGSGAFRHITAQSIEEMYRQSHESSAQPLDNAIVLISYGGAGVGDVGTTALASNQPRVALHASALSDLIQNRHLHRAPRWADLLAVFLVCLLGSLASLCRRTIPLLAFWALVLIAGAGASAVLVIQVGWVVGLVFASSLWTLWTGAEVARRYSNELIQRLKLRATMSLYFSPRVMDHVLKNPGSMEPQEAELTVLLTDLRNSTPIVELTGARGTFELLNQVFEAQTEAVMNEDGSLEHFLGDQFLSYWGAPDPQPDAADRAFRAALKLISAMERVRAQLTPEVRALFGYGVALHSGRALLGNKGSVRRLDYGLVGDLINAASRVEALTKQYGVLFLVTRETFERLSSPPHARVLDEVVVKGKSSSLQLIELKHPYSPANFEAITVAYSEAFAHYRRGDFTKAAEMFAALSEQQDRPSQLLLERCQELAASPPPEWRGIYTMKTK